MATLNDLAAAEADCKRMEDALRSIIAQAKATPYRPDGTIETIISTAESALTANGQS